MINTTFVRSPGVNNIFHVIEFVYKLTTCVHVYKDHILLVPSVVWLCMYYVACVVVLLCLVTIPGVTHIYIWFMCIAWH